jgi:hypothetical protein
MTTNDQNQLEQYIYETNTHARFGDYDDACKSLENAIQEAKKYGPEKDRWVSEKFKYLGEKLKERGMCEVGDRCLDIAKWKSKKNAEKTPNNEDYGLEMLIEAGLEYHNSQNQDIQREKFTEDLFVKDVFKYKGGKYSMFTPVSIYQCSGSRKVL